MDESEDSMIAEDIKNIDSLLTGTTKPKKRSIIERELETSLTAKVTSPATNEGTGTSRYGRTLRLKTDLQNSDKKLIIGAKSPVKTQSPVYKMHASNSPLKSESSKTTSGENFLENQIDNIYLENISLSRFGTDEVMNTPPAKKFSKVYTRKDLIQTRDAEENIVLIKNKFLPARSGKKHASHLTNILERSAEEYNLSSPGKSQNGYRDNSSVVKTLDFDGKKKIKDNKESRIILSKSDLFDLEAQCTYQVGDLAWARMGTYPFWPCIVTRDPTDGIFVKKKLFGRIERDIIHVTFFGDNGRRGWIVDTMLRKYLGQQEFHTTRDNFTPEDKKKDPRLYAAYFVSEKKQALWNTSIQEAELLLREPKRLRIDIFNDMLIKSRNCRSKQRSGKISRTSSDVSLSESLYDSLFSEDDVKSENTDRSRNIAKNKSLDVSDVVTACLDNMAAKTGITKIQKQSHMDRWLQKAKSKTPEKIQVPIKIEKDIKVVIKKKKKTPNKDSRIQNVYSLRRSVYESQDLLQFHNEHDDNRNMECVIDDSKDNNLNSVQPSCGIGITVKVESINDKVLRNPEVLNYDTAEEPKNVVCENYTSHSIDSTEYNVQDINSKIDVNLNRDSSSITEEPIMGSEKIDLRTKCESYEIVSSLCDGGEINATKKRAQDKNSQDSKKILNQRDIEDTTEHCTADCGIEANVKKGTVEAIIGSKNTNSSIKNELCNDPKEIDTTKNHTIVCCSVELTECNTQDKIESDVIANKHSFDGTKKSVSEMSQKKDLYTECLKPELVSPHSVDYEINVTKNQNMEKINQDDKEKLSQFINRTTQQCMKDCDINVETNVQIDFDSDSDIQLPYSPLSVNLNKDESSIEELDEIIEHKDLNDFYEPEMTNEFQRENESENEILKYDLDKTIVNVFNPKQCKNSFDKNQKHTSPSKKLPAIDVRRLTEQKCYSSSIDDQKSYDNKESHALIDQQKIIGDEMSDNSLIDVHVTENQKDFSKTEPTKVSIQSNEIGSKDVIKIKYDKKESNKAEHVNSNKVIRNIKHKETILNDNNVTKEKCNILGIEIEDKYSVAGNENSNINEVMTKMHDHTQTCIPESIKVNGFHEINSHLNKDFNIETSSTHSDDITIIKSENSRKLRSKVNKNENPLNDPNFMKYLELRQDAIMDENPELTYDEVVAYSLKTWLYEETLKNETKKKEDSLRQSFLKGPNKKPTQRDWKKNLRLKKTNKLNLSPTQKSNRDVFLDNHSNKTFSKDSTVIENNLINVEPVILKSEIDTTDTTTFENIQEKTSYSRNSNNTELQENDADAILNIPHNSFLDENNDGTINSKGAKRKIETVINSSDLDRENHKESTNHQSEIKTEDVQNNDSTEHEDSNAHKNLEDREKPLIKCKLRSKNSSNKYCKDINVGNNIKNEIETDRLCNNAEDIDVSMASNKKNKIIKARYDNPEFIKYLELRKDALLDENPLLTHDEIVLYLYQTWLYEENAKSDLKKSEEIVQSSLIKGFNDNSQPPKNIKLNKIKTEKELVENNISHKEKPKRKSIKPYYNEEYSDIEEELEYFEIFKTKNKKPKVEADKTSGDKSVHTQSTLEEKENTVEEKYDLAEFYFKQLTKPKPNIFKGLIREKVCEICEKTDNLVKCKGCNGMFHIDCVKKETKIVEVHAPTRGRKKKKKVGRKPKSQEDTETQEDGSEDQNVSIEEIIETESHTVDANVFEALLTAKMKEMIENSPIQYDSYSSDDGLDWAETVPGKCEIVDIKHKQRDSQINFTNYKCNDCQKYDTPICFVCKSAVSKNECPVRQRCHVAHCYKYYHLECLNHWPQTQFSGGVPSKNKINEHFEALTCPRHVCHTCVSDDPRGCKTRFSGDKLARCVRCPATYHSFMKCLPAGTQILTASHIICPRHYKHRPGKIPCHVNTGWCFICALGGSLICCEYCPTSFHAECLNIKPPEGGYMCEDCETGRLPLYGEMVWVKLGHYRWWPGMVLHPTEIPENILAVKHSPGEFVVRFFGQYDHYWTNRGRVFPFQEGDSGRISSHKSKIDAAFITAMEHAQRACEILKSAKPNDEESLDIASSLLPPHYVKLKVNKPCGSLCGKRLEDPESSFTQCECNPLEEDPCGPYSHCLNRMLLTECGPMCRAGDRCNNRAFEKRLYPKLVPYRTPTRGWGLKTLEDIKAGQFVIEYVGELIDEEEFRRRMRRKFEIRDENFYFLTLDKERMIDAGPKGNLARFMNHCCEPNCETQKWTVLGDVRVGLFAIHDIPANSEVTFNYNLECAGIEKKQCMCGAKRCSGYIGAKPKQDESLLKKNKLLPKRTYKKRKPIEESPSSSKNKPKRPLGRPPKPKELTEIEKDLLIIKSATNGVSSDESSRSLSVEYDRHPKALKRKRVSFSTEDVTLCNNSGSPKVKKHKLDIRKPSVGD